MGSPRPRDHQRLEQVLPGEEADRLLPVIYPPQVAILGFGAIQQRPWVVEERVQIRSIITASLAADHRVSDGHRGALYLRRVEELLQQPEAL